ncbi:MAG: Hef nuclease [Candidatus Methanogaster sp.]|uniref:Hef nuclease n=1 Tax=Candidatus Methanogaster sp. TaxID=3386292 RepID=A0AC61KZJ6_9EURY|nr:MAG: Hef nuclease [ANME-2 cluster archaeon]
MSKYISHPLIRKDMIEQRLYQLSVASSALKSSCLAVLPTGLGKTIVALMVIAARLNDLGGKVLILSPTKPLVEQHSDFFRQALPSCTVATFTGSILPEKRAELWKDSQVIVSTPQVIENDLRARRIDLRSVVHITFDEAHRAVGRYAYVYIAKRYFEDLGAGAGADVDVGTGAGAGADAKSRLVLGITASPGSNPETIADVCENLHIESVEVKSETDSDVIPYLHDRDIEWVRVEIPSMIKELKSVLEKVLLGSCSKLADLGFNVSPDSSKRELLDLQSKLHAQVAEVGDRDSFSAISVLAEIFKISHAIELGETQGVEALRRYFDRLNAEARSGSGSKAAKRLAMDPDMRSAISMLSACDEEHPKLDAVRRIVADQLRDNLDSRVIVFTNFRDSAEMVTDALSDVNGVSAIRFVGQASKYKDKGLTQKQQTEIISKFKSGEYNTLVATSVAEEGLDIPSTDLVLFYEPVPSEIRTIQRKGRTGRKRAGRIVVLIAKGSRDEAAYWISARKEAKMLATIANMGGSRSKSKQVSMPMPRPIRDPAIEQKQLTEFSDEGLVAYIDHREIRSGVSQILEAAGVEVVMRTLEIGDYLLSGRTCVERKTTSDFISSLISGRRELFGQISDLARTFDRPVLIIEGDDLYGQRQIHPNAVRGALTAIAIDFGVPILMSKDATDTALMLAAIARREQQDHGREVAMHGTRSAMMLPQQQEYVVSAIPEVGPVVAKNLLKHFGTVAAVMSASREELMAVELVGPKTADRIREVVGGEYKG